jgi:hypothetical protein
VLFVTRCFVGLKTRTIGPMPLEYTSIKVLFKAAHCYRTVPYSTVQLRVKMAINCNAVHMTKTNESGW